jgi:hypothetical protein
LERAKLFRTFGAGPDQPIASASGYFHANLCNVGIRGIRLMLWPWPNSTDMDGIRAVIGSQSCSESQQFGAPRTTKMDTTVSPWRYFARGAMRACDLRIPLPLPFGT